MTDWEVTVVTDSNYLKKVRVDDCVTRQDAEAAALGMTGAQRVVVSNPKTYNDETSSYSSSPNYMENDDGSGAFGIFLIIFLMIVIAAWKYILLFGLIGASIWYFFFRNK